MHIDLTIAVSYFRARYYPYRPDYGEDGDFGRPDYDRRPNYGYGGPRPTYGGGFYGR